MRTRKWVLAFMCSLSLVGTVTSFAAGKASVSGGPGVDLAGQQVYSQPVVEKHEDNPSHDDRVTAEDLGLDEEYFNYIKENPTMATYFNQQLGVDITKISYSTFNEMILAKSQNPEEINNIVEEADRIDASSTEALELPNEEQVDKEDAQIKSGYATVNLKFIPESQDFNGMIYFNYMDANSHTVMPNGQIKQITNQVLITAYDGYDTTLAIPVGRYSYNIVLTGVDSASYKVDEPLGEFIADTKEPVTITKKILGQVKDSQMQLQELVVVEDKSEQVETTVSVIKVEESTAETKVEETQQSANDALNLTTWKQDSEVVKAAKKLPSVLIICISVGVLILLGAVAFKILVVNPMLAREKHLDDIRERMHKKHKLEDEQEDFDSSDKSDDFDDLEDSDDAEDQDDDVTVAELAKIEKSLGREVRKMNNTGSSKSRK